MKIAIFDVSDPQHPKQKFVEILGDMGSDSLVLRDHRAFLFDKEKELLIFPAYVVEKDNPKNTFSGAYIYNINLKDGFKLKGRIFHYEEEREIPRYSYYSAFSIIRTLLIENFLYTISERKVGINKLDDLAKVTEIGH